MHQTRFALFKFLCVPLALSLASLSINGCSLFSSSEEEKPQEPRELTKEKTYSKPQAELALLTDAQQHYEHGLYSVAHDSFIKIKDDYPTGAYAEYALIKAADCSFEQKDFRAASKSYEEALTASPGKLTTAKLASTSKHSDYLLFRAALSNQLLDPGSARDTSRLEHAKQLYDRLIAEVPQSPYANLAKQHVSEVEHSLAKNDIALLDYYDERQKKDALSARGKEFKTKYGIEPRRFSAEEDEKAQEASAEPTPVPATPEETENKTDDSSNEQPDEPKQIVRKKIYIAAMTCDPATTTAVLELGGDTEGMSESDVVKTQDSSGIEILSPVARRISKDGEHTDCISKNDLIITPQGEFHFLGADTVQVDTESKPPKIIIGVNTN